MPEGDARRLVRLALPAVVLVLLTSAAVPAHPHVHVLHAIEVRLGPGGPECLRLAWVFDPKFSLLLLQTFDADRDGRLSAVEEEQAAHDQRDKLKAFRYFVDLRLDGASVPVTSVQDFRVQLTGDRAEYVFAVPLLAPAAERGVLELVVEDPTGYSGFVLRHTEPVVVQAPPEYLVECRVTKLDHSANPRGVRCEYQRRRG